jgi:hypothetical protein
MTQTATSQLALGISVAVAVWNILQYRLAGGRVRVTLLAGLWDDYSLAAGRDWPGLIAAFGDRGGWTVETAVIDIENTGRTAVTIAAPALDFGRSPRWRGKRRSVTPRPLEAPGAVGSATHRLEPFDSVRYVYDLWQVMDDSPFGRADRPPRPLRVRAAVKVAGKRRLCRSPWRRGWRVRDGQYGFGPDSDQVGLVAYRAMRRYLSDSDATKRFDCISAAIAIRERFPTDGAPPTAEDISNLLKENHHGDGPPIVGGPSLAAEHHLRRLYSGTVERIEVGNTAESTGN